MQNFILLNGPNIGRVKHLRDDITLLKSSGIATYTNQLLRPSRTFRRHLLHQRGCGHKFRQKTGLPRKDCPPRPPHNRRPQSTIHGVHPCQALLSHATVSQVQVGGIGYVGWVWGHRVLGLPSHTSLLGAMPTFLQERWTVPSIPGQKLYFSKRFATEKVMSQVWNMRC